MLQDQSQQQDAYNQQMQQQAYGGGMNPQQQMYRGNGMLMQQ